MFEYTPQGAGFAVATDRFVGLLSVESTPGIIPALFRLLESPTATVDHVLGLLAGAGAGERFALVELVDLKERAIRLTVRGEVVVQLSTATTSRFTWPSGTTWINAEVSGVDSFRLALAHEEQEGIRLPFRHGAVAAGDVVATLAARTDGVPEPAGEAFAPAVPSWLLDGDAQAAKAPTALTAPTAPSLPTEHDTHSRGLAPVTGVMPGPTGAPFPQPAADISSHDESFGDTLFAPGPAASLGAPTIQPAPQSPPAPQPVSSAASAASDQASAANWTLVLPDGSELDAAAQIVVGRRPWRTDPEETSTYYIVAPSPGREISGKHVEFAIVGDQLHARDLASTNGTLVLSPARPPRLLHEGRDMSLEIGDTLDLGEGFRIVVSART